MTMAQLQGKPRGDQMVKLHRDTQRGKHRLSQQSNQQASPEYMRGVTRKARTEPSEDVTKSQQTKTQINLRHKGQLIAELEGQQRANNQQSHCTHTDASKCNARRWQPTHQYRS